jgi:hypothetical protein
MHTRICTHTHVQIMVKFEDDLNAEGITEQRKVSARYVIPVPAVTAAAATGSYTNGSSGGTGSKRASPVQQQLSPPSSNSSNHSSAYGEYEDTTGVYTTQVHAATALEPTSFAIEYQLCECSPHAQHTNSYALRTAATLAVLCLRHHRAT